MGQVNELKGFTHGQIDTVLMKIGHDAGVGTAEGIRMFLANQLVVSRPPCSWHEQGGVIYFSVRSDGTTGEGWIMRLEKNGIRIGDYAKSVLRSKDFKPTSGHLTKVAVLKGLLFEDNDRSTKKVHAFAAERKLEAPNAEVACLIRDAFSDEEIEVIGLWRIVTMHGPINDYGGGPRLLGVGRSDDGRWLSAYYGRPEYRWFRACGFAFAVSQVSSQT